MILFIKISKEGITVHLEQTNERNDFTDRFLDLLNDKMKETGMTLADIAKKSGVSKPALSNYQNDTQKPGFVALNKIATYFNVSLDYLAGRTNVARPSIEEKAAEKRYGLNEDVFETLKEWTGFYGATTAGPTPHDCELALHGVNLLFETVPMDFFISISRYYEHYFNKPLPYETDSELYDNYNLTPEILDSSILLRIQKYLIDGRDRNDKYRKKLAEEKAKRAERKEKRRQKKEEN